MLAPSGILGFAALRAVDQTRLVLAIGAAFQLIVCVFSFFSSRSWRQPVTPSVITLYLIALGWFWISERSADDWFHHLAQALLLTIPLGVFAIQALTNSGAPARRRARILADRLANRKDWPADLAACRNLPEVKALREALHLDATPALNLLFSSVASVQMAVLAALEFHKNWRPGQADLVLRVAQRAKEPAIRAAAVSALANVDDRLILEALAGFLRDPSRDVRRAATESLLWESGRRWSWIRHSVRQALADPALEGDGPLQCEGQELPADAIADLDGWASQKGLLAVRAVRTLGAHYRRVLNEQADDGLLKELQRRLDSPRTSPALRIELAQVLRTLGQWSDEQLHRLLDRANPAPLRLIGAEALLAKGPHDGAIATLYEVARLPNREIALATAEIVQRRLNVDLGLPLGQPLPALHTRQAAEITRRVMVWANKLQGLSGSGSRPVVSGTDQKTKEVAVPLSEPVLE